MCHLFSNVGYVLKCHNIIADIMLLPYTLLTTNYNYNLGYCSDPIINAHRLSVFGHVPYNIIATMLHGNTLQLSACRQIKLT